MSTTSQKKTKQQKKEEKHAKSKEKQAQKDDKRRCKKLKPCIVQNKKVYTVAIEIFGKNMMTEKEVRSLCSQICQCYSLNQRVFFPVNLVISNYKKIADNLDSGHKRWDIRCVDIPLLNDPDISFVYLSADADDVLIDPDPTVFYVIGGLVDRNRLAGVVQNYCLNRDVRSVRLPLKEHCVLSSSCVLTCDQVFGILVTYFWCKDWKQALKENIPQRKVVKWL
ncbi:hypothetical protein EDEG_02213 [Edhazardia aedis USNM 41457]|uniref:tRNA (guanine(9)-N1)-methyltransferase n=1 Tax=Edhazardia aedis (strain USNM 41457) TaxID=1003232 RepID=J8ZUT9_EDHAE|nr:hypothetical protein EDEG_02213 [Edhazardia aedis USNM 41457]|eukprot:EJW03448.1 hypothetical protein EDEG_02213 [Edhazardia aedis USNM 41457]